MGVILLPAVGFVVLLVGVAIWTLVKSPAIIIIVPALAALVVFVMVDRRRNAEKEMAATAQRARFKEQRERERRERNKGQKEKIDPRFEATNRRVEELGEEISVFMAEGIRENFIGKTSSDFFDFGDRHFGRVSDEVFGGMTEEERIRHMRYVTLNGELKNQRPSRFLRN